MSRSFLKRLNSNRQPREFPNQNHDRIEDVYHYQTHNSLGRGTTGIVTVATHKLTGTKVAIKYIPREAAAEVDVYEEAKYHSVMSHVNIISFYEIFVCQEGYHMILELATGGELLQTIASLEEYTEQYAALVIRQLLEAIEHIHSHGIAHLDVKPENIFIADANAHPVVIKLADFGVARSVMDDDHSLRNLLGTYKYISPEVAVYRKRYGVSHNGYGRPVDIWSAGVILYELLSGINPFDCGNDESTLAKVEAGKITWEGDSWSSISKESKNLIAKMLIANPDSRISASAALVHPFLQLTRPRQSVTLSRNVQSQLARMSLEVKKLPTEPRSRRRPESIYMSEPVDFSDMNDQDSADDFGDGIQSMSENPNFGDPMPEDAIDWVQADGRSTDEVKRQQELRREEIQRKRELAVVRQTWRDAERKRSSLMGDESFSSPRSTPGADEEQQIECEDGDGDNVEEEIQWIAGVTGDHEIHPNESFSISENSTFTHQELEARRDAALEQAKIVSEQARLRLSAATKRVSEIKKKSAEVISMLNEVNHVRNSTDALEEDLEQALETALQGAGADFGNDVSFSELERRMELEDADSNTNFIDSNLSWTTPTSLRQPQYGNDENEVVYRERDDESTMPNDGELEFSQFNTQQFSVSGEDEHQSVARRPTNPLSPRNAANKLEDVRVLLSIPGGKIYKLPLGKAIPIGRHDRWNFTDQRCGSHQADLLARTDGLWLLVRSSTPCVIYPRGTERYLLHQNEKVMLNHGDGFTLIPLVNEGFKVVIIRTDTSNEVLTSSIPKIVVPQIDLQKAHEVVARLSSSERSARVSAIKQKRDMEQRLSGSSGYSSSPPVSYITSGISPASTLSSSPTFSTLTAEQRKSKVLEIQSKRASERLSQRNIRATKVTQRTLTDSHLSTFRVSEPISMISESKYKPVEAPFGSFDEAMEGSTT